MTEQKAATDKNKERYPRWQGRSLDQMGYTLNLILIIITATIGFIISLLLSTKFTSNIFSFLMLGLITLIICSTVTISTILIRLLNFRKTAQMVREKEKDNKDQSKIDKLKVETDNLGDYTWKSLYVAIVLFVIGYLFIGVSLISHVFIFQTQ